MLGYSWPPGMTLIGQTLISFTRALIPSNEKTETDDIHTWQKSIKQSNERKSYSRNDLERSEFEDKSKDMTPVGGLFFDHPSGHIPGLLDYIDQSPVDGYDGVNVWNEEIWQSAYGCSFQPDGSDGSTQCGRNSTLNSYVCPLQVCE